MRTKLLVFIAGAAVALGTALVTLPAAPAAAAGEFWDLCSGAADEYCVESASVLGGASVTPGPTATAGRDFPWIKSGGSAHYLNFGIYNEGPGDGSTLSYDFNPSVAYVMVVRTGTFRPREMTANASNADFTVSGNASTGWKATIQWQPTAIHHVAAPCSFDGGCGDSSTRADNEDPYLANGSLFDLVGSGLSAREIVARQGMMTATDAQNSYPYFDPDTNTLEIRMANPHLDQSGVPVTDGTYDGFIPNAYLIMMGVPDPSALTKSAFAVTKTVAGTTTTAPFSFVSEPDGVRIRFTNISFSRPKFKIRVKPMPPGKPRLYDVVKISGTKAKVKFSPPVANGNARINTYQARCHKAGKAWRYKSGLRRPLTVSRLPRGKVYCQVRAHNYKGWGRWSSTVRS